MTDMKDDLFQPPAFGESTAPFHRSDETLQLLAQRRSTAADFLGGPGPSEDQLQKLLQIAARVPDHRRVSPFRFIVFAGDARSRFGDVLAARFRENEPDATPERVEKERARFERAPIVVGVVSTVQRHHRTPEWEQVLTAGAVAQNLLIAASAMGFAGQWLTEWYAFDEQIFGHLNLRIDDEVHERIAGFVYLGTAKEPPKERARPDLSQLVSGYGA